MLVAPSRAAERAVAATAIESCGSGAKMQQAGLSQRRGAVACQQVSGGGGEQVRELKANLEISILHHLWISGTN